MKIVKWEQLPPEMQTEEIRKYYDILKKKFIVTSNYKVVHKS